MLHSVLEIQLPDGCNIICFADDTLVIDSGISIGEVISVAHRAVSLVIDEIEKLNIKVAVHKTDAVFFPPLDAEHPILQYSINLSNYQSIPV